MAEETKRCSKCEQTKPLDEFNKDLHKTQGRYHQCRSCYQQRARDDRKRIRDEMIAAYGGACACCGESTPEFLTCDHIHNDGAAERRSLKKFGGHNFYRWLKRLEWPEDRYQLLCANCQLGKLLNGGVCPHLAERERRQRRAEDTNPNYEIAV